MPAHLLRPPRPHRLERPATAAGTPRRAAQHRRLRARPFAAAKSCAICFVRDRRAPQDLAYVSSPLVRARKTMELMRATLGLEPAGYSVDARLAEIAFGEWEGLTYADVLARDQDVVARRESDKWGFLPPGGESYAQLTVRMRRLARDASTATRWSRPMAAPRARSSRISRSRRRRTPRTIPSTRAWSMCSRAAG